MTEFELNQIIADHTNTLNQLTEFWITLSFGVIVAATYIPEKLDTRFRRVLTWGYLCTSLILIAGRANFTYMAVNIVTRMEELGYEPLEFHPFFGTLASAGIFLVMIFGTMGILYYIRHASGD